MSSAESSAMIPLPMVQCSSLSDDSTIYVELVPGIILSTVVVSYVGYADTIDSSLLRCFITLAASDEVLAYGEDDDAGMYFLTSWSVVPSSFMATVGVSYS